MVAIQIFSIFQLAEKVKATVWVSSEKVMDYIFDTHILENSSKGSQGH